jgi:hypothetical protein
MGFEIVAIGRQPRVVSSLPTKGNRVTWAVVDVGTREVLTSRTLRGELRDGLFDATRERLLLTTHALCRVSVEGELRVIETMRPKGFGTYLWRLLPIGPEHVGATGWTTGSVAVFRRDGGELVKRIRIPSPHLAIQEGEVVRPHSPHGGQCLDLGLPELKRVRQRPMPLGSVPVVHGGELFLLHGPKEQEPCRSTKCGGSSGRSSWLWIFSRSPITGPSGVRAGHRGRRPGPPAGARSPGTVRAAVAAAVEEQRGRDHLLPGRYAEPLAAGEGAVWLALIRSRAEVLREALGVSRGRASPRSRKQPRRGHDPRRSAEHGCRPGRSVDHRLRRLRQRLHAGLHADLGAEAEELLALRYPKLREAEHAVIACPRRRIQPGGETRCWILARVGQQRSVVVRLSPRGNAVEIDD